MYLPLANLRTKPFNIANQIVYWLQHYKDLVMQNFNNHIACSLNIWKKQSRMYYDSFMIRYETSNYYKI